MRALRCTATALAVLALALAVAAAAGIIAHIVLAADPASLLTGGGLAAALSAPLAGSGPALAGLGAALAGAVVAAELNGRRRPAASALLGLASLALYALSYLLLGGDALVPAGSPESAAAAIAAAVVAMLSLSSIMSMFRGNYATGAEHGAERMATAREAASIADRRFFFNNFVYSALCAQSYTAWSRRLRDGQTARNRNDVTYGTSGMGKTHNCVLPDLMNAVGYDPDAFPPCMCGPRWAARNALEHLLPGALPASGLPRRLRSRAARIAAAHPEFGSGWDVVHTDPKGDNLRDIGHLYERAGYDIKLFDTVAFKGLCYNPLAYIDEHYTDVVPPESLRCRVAAGSLVADGSGARPQIDPSSRFEAALDPRLVPGDMWAASAGEAGVSVRASMSARQKVDRASAQLREEDYRALGITAEQWEAASDGELLLDAAGGILEVAPAGGRTFGVAEGSSAVAKLLRSQVYTRSRVSVELRIECPRAADEVADVAAELVLDRCLLAESADVRVERSGTVAGAEVSLDRLASERAVDVLARGMEPGSVLWVTVEADIESYRVPDGVQLTKVVECLAANMKTDVAEASHQDPFWEDCKRLALIAFAAAAFEWYGPEERNLVTCIDLLNMASPEGGDPRAMSPLAYLMHRWEHGQVWQAADAGRRGGPLGRHAPGGAGQAGWADSPDHSPHSRTSSMALHAFHAFTAGAPETVQSVIATCQTAFTAMISPDVKKMLSRDEMHLETLGDTGQRQALFIVTKDTDSPYDFLTALIVYQALDVMLDKAYKRYGGKLPRHVRFVLDEAMTIGKIPILTRAIAVVRSRNASISLYMQSKAQAEEVYGEKEAKIIVDNCTAQRFLGGQSADTLKEFSEAIGDETVYAHVTNRSFDGGIGPHSVSEHIQGNARKVRTAAQLRQMENTKLLVFVLGMRAVEDRKFPTSRHPYWPYVHTSWPRPLTSPAARVEGRFDYPEYLAKRDAARARAAADA